MFRFSLIGVLIGGLLLAACAGAAPQGTRPYPGTVSPGGTVSPAGTLSPESTVVSPPYPSAGESNMPDWKPSPGDENLKRGQVFLDKTEILTMESFPPQFMLHIKGALPTPCHKLRVEVGKPDEQNRIDVEVYSLSDPNEVCIQVLQAFDENIPLGSYPSGTYTVYVNGEKVGELKA